MTASRKTASQKLGNIRRSDALLPPIDLTRPVTPVSLRQWLDLQYAGAYKPRDTNTQIQAGWFDWFCRDSALANHTAMLATFVRELCAKPIPYVGLDDCYVSFKNCLCSDGTMYDVIRFADLRTHNTTYVIVALKNGGYEYNNDDGEFVFTRNWQDVLDYYHA